MAKKVNRSRASKIHELMTSASPWDVLNPPPAGWSTLPDDPAARKGFPLATGVLDYFPDALIAISELSRIGNDQHNPGQPLHWARGKGGNNADEALRHFVQRGTVDVDNVRHLTKSAWRILALLQLELEEAAIQRAAKS